MRRIGLATFLRHKPLKTDQGKNSISRMKTLILAMFGLLALVNAAPSRPSNEEVLKKVAEERVDTLDEKSDVVTNYEAGTPVSQGNLYYYYYPVAAYPVNAQATDKVSATSGTSDLLSSPLLFILVPLLLLLVAVPVIALLSNTSTGRAFSGRNSDLDEKFGSFAELQTAIDYQLAKYMTALDSEDCMDRIVCELGVKASNIPHKNMFYR